MNADPTVIGQGIFVVAVDQSLVTAKSSDFQVNLWKFPSIKLGKASASNEVQKDISAIIVSADLVVDNGAVKVDAQNLQDIRAVAKAMAVIDVTPSIIPKASVSLGGTWVWNEILGDVVASVMDGTVQAASFSVLALNLASEWHGRGYSGEPCSQYGQILSNGGSIFNAAGSTMNVTATNLRLPAWNAIGTAERHLTTNADNMSADPYTQGAGIYITERDSITITSVGAVVLLFIGEALTTTITDLAQSGLVTGKNGNILLVTEHGSITLDDGADGDGIAISANGTGSIQLEANGTGSGIVVNADMVSGSGSITLFAVDDIEQHADISSSGTTVHVESSGGSIIMDQGVQTVDSNGTIVYRACKDVFLALLHAEHGAVQLYAEIGSITSNTTGLNVRSERALFKAHVNVGLRTISPLNLSVDSLAAEAETGMMSLVNEGTVTVTSLGGSEVPEAESYLLVLERDKMEFASRWFEETAWQPFEKLPEGIYEWSVYCWVTDGLKLVSGPMYFRI